MLLLVHHRQFELLLLNLSVASVREHQATEFSWITITGHHRYRLLVQDHVPGGQDGAAAAVGHRGPGEVPLPHPQLHPRQCYLVSSEIIKHDA